MRNLHIFGLIAAATLGAGIVACTTETTTTGSSSGSSGSDGGSSGASSSSGSSGNNRGFGVISVNQTEFAAGPTTIISSTATASFGKAGSATTSGAPKCTQSKEGACTVSECDLSTVGDAGTETDAGSEKAPNAGEITLSGGDIPAPGVKLAVKANGSYEFYSSQTKLFSSGQTITAKAAGADVPAFEKAVAVPAAIKLTAPACTAGNCGEIDSSKDFEVTWTDGGAGTVGLSASSSEAGKKLVSITCSFASSAGKGTVPAAALGKLTKGAGSVTINAGTTDLVAAGDYDVTVIVGAMGTTGQATIK